MIKLYYLDILFGAPGVCRLVLLLFPWGGDKLRGYYTN